MPGNHGEITVAERNRVDNDNKKTKEKDVNQTGTNDDSENRIQLVVPSVSKPGKQFKDRFRKKHKSRSGSCKGGCFSVMRHPRTEEEEDEGSPSSSSALDHGMLRVMLENNDFFSDECNPHR